MILRSITLDNFGLYAGKQTLNLVPGREVNGERPVVLVGGKNGAGKSTLLEAVRLALYGKRALGYRIGQSEYEDHVRTRMHLGLDGTSASNALIELEFDYAEAGRLQRYRVTRSWSTRGSKVSEDLTLEKDGEPVRSVPRDEWQHFLQELIPPGVSQLFFFDGEKIAEIARDGSDEGLADAVRELLGIELVGRLRIDLSLYVARHMKKGSANDADKIHLCEREVEELARALESKLEEVAELRTLATSAAKTASEVRQRYVVEGGDAASRRVALEAARTETRHQIARREAELRELANALLPLAVAPKLMARFSQAISVSLAKDQGADRHALQEQFLAWRASESPPREAEWVEGHWRDLEAFLKVLSGPQLAVELPLGNLEIGEKRMLLQRVSEIRENVSPRSALLCAELEALTGRLREIEADLVRASGKATDMLSQELKVADLALEGAEARFRTVTEEHRQLEYKFQMAKRELDQLSRLQNESRAADDRSTLAQRVGRALEQYEERLLEQKLVQLEQAFVTRFNHLARKDGFVAEVRIDRVTFQPTLVDAAGREIPKSGLSAGEKQIYAVAMLWALASTCGRPLPMIIDTPLARLDADHRRAIVERYFPAASHQVIVLSTDTEIDGDLLERLGPSVSHAYRLDYQPERRATVVSNGYFGTERDEGLNALQQG